MIHKIQSALWLAAIFVLACSLHAQGQSQSQRVDKRPLVYGLVIDNSASLRSQMRKAIDISKLIVSRNQPDDETFLVRFVNHENIKTIQDFTSSQTVLIDKLDDLYIEPGKTAIFDALDYSIKHLSQDNVASNLAKRRAIILITDGDDTGSHYHLDELLKSLREKSIQVYVIGLVEELEQQGIHSKERAVNHLSNIAEASGGEAYFPTSTSEVTNIATRIVNEIRRH